MKTLRTPDARFANLPGYDFAPHYTEVDDGDGGSLRIHHFELGPESGETVLLMHGQPSWSYLYRKMAPVFAAAGYHVVAPDLVGFGRSDKPVERSDYTYANHVAWMSRWLEARDLRGINLFCQDWGGLIGLRLVAAFPDRFARVVVANTGLPTGVGPREAAESMHALYATVPIVSAAEVGERFASEDGPPGFFFWRKYAAESPDFSVGDVMDLLAEGGLPSDIRAAYEAPFPDPSFEAGARQFPSLVPIFPDDVEIPANEAAWKVLEGFDKPFMTSFAADDPVTAGMEQIFQTRVPGAKGIEHVTMEDAGHFLQETKGEQVAEAMIAFMRAT